VRRAIADIDRVISAQYAAGHYGGTTRITVAGAPALSELAADAVTLAQKRGTIKAKITVHPGPLFTFGDIAFLNAETAEPVTGFELDRNALGLGRGQPALAARVLSGEQKIISAMRNKGYPFAAVSSRQAIADHATHKLDITFRLSPGRRATMGPVTVRGATRMNPGFVARRVTALPGILYSPERMEKINENLRRLDVFSSIRVREGKHPTADGRIPIVIDVQEQKRHFVGFGANYSTTEGAGLNAYWGDRNLFGHAEHLRLDASVSRLFENTFDNLEYKFGGQFTRPGILQANDDLLFSAYYLREAPDAYTRRGFTTNLNLQRHFTEELTGGVGAEFERSHVVDVFGTHDYTLVGVPFEAKYDSTDSLLDPTKGFRVLLSLEPFPSFLGSSVGMTIAKATASTYHAFDTRNRFILAGRLSLGSIIGADTPDVPANRRFFAGGGGSIRGIAYQNASPHLDGKIAGGRSLLEGSVELRAKVTDTIGIVPFFDFGAAFDSPYPDFRNSLRYAVGLGLRYYTAIGPIRLDVAHALNGRPDDPAVAVYVSIGQAF
jgi:translocation and assembly module TamA